MIGLKNVYLWNICYTFKDSQWAFYKETESSIIAVVYSNIASFLFTQDMQTKEKIRSMFVSSTRADE